MTEPTTSESPIAPRVPSDSLLRRVPPVAWVVAAGAAFFAAVAAFATNTSVADGWLFNADEAVSILLAEDLGRGQLPLLFPGNSYQGVLELPAYVVSWFALGPGALPLRVFHQLMWIGALAAWTFVAFEFLDRARVELSESTKAWTMAAVFGLVGFTSVDGWLVWFRIYPGYHTGALLGALAVLVACRSRGLRWWFVAGLLAGLAVYAQPMHGAASVVVGVLALGTARQHRLPSIATSAAGWVLGSFPLVLWNLRNGWVILDSDSQPVAHPEWGYVDRLFNTVRVSDTVLWGRSWTRDEAITGFAATYWVALVALVVVLVLGVAVLARSWRSSAPLIAGLAVMALGLPVLDAFSLDVDLRYAVAWWPVLVVLVAAAVAGVASGGLLADRRLGRNVVVPIVVMGVVAQTATVVLAGIPMLRSRSEQPNTEQISVDLVTDLQRCGVDAVIGDYWSVYVVAWASDATIDAAVPIGLERLPELAPQDWDAVERVAALVPGSADPAGWGDLMANATGRKSDGWLATSHPDSGTVVLLEVLDDPLPDGCLGDEGLRP